MKQTFQATLCQSKLNLQQKTAGLDSRISEHFGKSTHFILIDLHKDGPRSWFAIENPGARIETKRGIEAAHLLAKHKADVLIAKEVGEGPYHVLRDSSIQIFALTEESDIQRVLGAFSRKELRSLAHPKEFD